MAQRVTTNHKIKALRPSRREKKRYIHYKIISDTRHDAKAVEDCVDTAILRFLGELGYAKAGIVHLRNHTDATRKEGIVRVSAVAATEVQAALTLLDRFNDNDCRIDILHVSGILKKITSKGE